MSGNKDLRGSHTRGLSLLKVDGSRSRGLKRPKMDGSHLRPCHFLKMGGSHTRACHFLKQLLRLTHGSITSLKWMANFLKMGSSHKRVCHFLKMGASHTRGLSLPKLDGSHKDLSLPKIGRLSTSVCQFPQIFHISF